MTAYVEKPAGIKCQHCKGQLVRLTPPEATLPSQVAYVCPTCDCWGRMT